MAGMLQDISDRKRTEIALKESESRFRSLCESSLTGIYIIQGGRIAYANPAMLRVLGRQPEELGGASLLAFLHPDDRHIAEESMRRRLDGEIKETRYEARFVRKTGEVVHVEVLGVRSDYGGEPALIGTVLDVTDRKRAEMAIEERLRSEKLLADLSAAFVNVPPDQLDELINQSLKTLVEFLGNDRSTVVKFTADKRQVLVTHCHAVAGCEPFPVGPISVDRLPWFLGQLHSGNIVFLS